MTSTPTADGRAAREETAEDDVAASPGVGGPPRPASDQHDRGRPESAPRKPGRARVLLTIAALGVVFGDIGTSPLYAFQTVFTIDGGRVNASRTDVLGVLSMTIWSIILIVALKYVVFVMRADNDGEGGVLALAALVRRVLGDNHRRAGLVLGLGMLGASLFYGDSLITPAISVISAFEGLEVPAPSLAHLVVPLAAGVLVVLFLVQRFGTSRIGTAFGPVMLLWFAAIAAAGVPGIVRDTGVLRALNISYALRLAVDRPSIAFVALGAVVLSITGCEALYADMGHFGRPPIRRAWFALVLPALLLNYLGQGALVLRTPHDVSNPFFLLLPSWAQLPMVVLAAAATVIASQAVISGAYSVSHQAVRLGLLPPLRIRQTSEREGGQIYVPAVNTLLLVGVLTLLLIFQHSARLATAYGIAVTGTLITTTVLFLTYARLQWRWPVPALVLFGAVVGGLEVIYLAANLTKIASGGWLPLLIAAVIFTVMAVWQRGRQAVTTRRVEMEGELKDFLDGLELSGIDRVPGTAVFPHPTKETVPLALRTNVEHNHVLHQHLVIVTAKAEQVPHVAAADRIVVDDLGHGREGVHHLTLRYGFSDRLDLSQALEQAAADGLLEPGVTIADASYFVSRATLRPGAHQLPRWQSALFIALARNAADPADVLGLPAERTVTMGAVLRL